jgi:anionic cell wall polymer biosynthesis LytR-Cps2A-Psr (LCP) family protein
VDIELTKTEASRINYELKKEPLPFDTNPDREKVEAVAGVHHLDGMQAVTYARIRGISGENDFNRSERQRKLLEVLLEQVMQDMSPGPVVELISVAMP